MDYVFGDYVALGEENILGAQNILGQVVKFLKYTSDSKYFAVVYPGDIKGNPTNRTTTVNGRTYIGTWHVPIDTICLYKREELL